MRGWRRVAGLALAAALAWTPTVAVAEEALAADETPVAAVAQEAAAEEAAPLPQMQVYGDEKTASIELEAAVQLTGATLEAGQFTFELTPIGADGDPVGPPVSVVNEGNGAVRFPLEYMVTGTFRYALTQKAGTAEGMTYDTQTYRATVQVSDLDAAPTVSWANADGAPAAPVFANSYTAPVTGSWKSNGKGTWWEWSDGTYPKGCWLDIEGKRYCFDNAGYRRTGWYLEGGTWYWLGSDGAMRTDWQRVNGVWYYLKPSGAMATGWQKLGGAWYYLKPSGAMATGWQKLGSTWYFLRGSGAMAEGWLKDGGAWYYLIPGSGAMATGWRLVDGVWYYLKGSGAMATGWQKVGSTWYFLRGSGAMATGWEKIGGLWYFLRGSGAMASNCWIDGTYYVGASGAMLTNAWTPDGYYVDGSGRWAPNAGRDAVVSKAQGYSSSTGYLILVDTSRNQVNVFTGKKGNWSLIKSTACSSGAPGTPTVRGEFTVGSRGYSFGSGYTCYYWTQFYSDYLFHSVLYNQGTHVIQDGRLGMNISHGCVRLPIEFAKWIYDTIPSGTKVVVYA